MNDLVVIEKQLQAYAPKFLELLPPELTPDRLIRTVMLSIEKTPTLKSCQPGSIIRAALSAAVLGLEVDGVTGQGYLVPFKGSAQFLVGYKGMVTLAARAGRTLEGHVVYEGDQFEYNEGQDALTHGWKLEAPRERVIGAYARSRSLGFPTVTKVVSLADILAIRDASPGGKRSDSPWRTHFPAMARKTAVRALSASVPVLSLQAAAALDTHHELGNYVSVSGRGEILIEGPDPEDPAIVEGELMPELLPGDRIPIKWPDGTSSEPFDKVRYTETMVRALNKVPLPNLDLLWKANTSGLGRLDDEQRARITRAKEERQL